ncbi:MAG TPA: hypothetical protein PKD26_15655 [Pyrinomonadaceae bacterium]|nr:hypothetical protein [Pyrinomonadaceae bacterium]
MVPLGFCCGGFSSTAGYVPGNEAQRSPKRVERRSTIQADHFLKALSVFIPTTQAGFPQRDGLGKPFGFGSWRSEQRLSAPAVRELCVTASAPPPGAGQNARKQFRLCRYLTPKIRDVKQKVL